MKKRLVTALSVFMIAALAACGAKKEKASLEDTPWNHGSFAIMETDDGYYYNQGKGGVLHSENQYVRQALTYHEKASGNEIFLCNKPECNHDGGNDCEATYKSIKVDNSVLYDGSIYILGTETEGTMVSVNLYKAALDGSAMDKVGCVIQAENTNNQKIYCSKSVTFYKFDQAIDSGFIIHNGNAYVTYFLQFGEGSSGLKGAGLCRMSLEDGSTEEIYQMEYLSSSFPIRVTGIGDYVYFNLGKLGTTDKSRRYVISTKEVQKVDEGFIGTEEEEKKTGNDYPKFVSIFYSEDRVYGYPSDVYYEDGIHFLALDAKTGQVMEDEEIVIHNGEGGEDYGAVKTAFLYDGKLFVGFENVACFYDLKGNLLGRVKAPLDLIGTNAFGESLLGDGSTSLTAATLYRDYKISNGNLYFLLSSQAEVMMDFEEMIETGETYYWQYVHVFSCPLEDAMQGKDSWKEAYVTTQGR